MNGNHFHEQLLSRCESELAAVGISVTADHRREMAEVLCRLDRVKTREESDALCDELDALLQARGNSAAAICPQPTWLAAVQCA